jgi:hypothetical protein
MTAMNAQRKSRKPIPHRNKSPYGWWIASYLERFEFDDENVENLNRRCLAWENTIVFKARDRNQAYRKAEKIGKLSDGNEAWTGDKARKGRWRYEGITSLLPIYEELTDGAEILWNEYQNVTVRRVKSMVKRKLDLECFDDDEPAD